MNNKFQARRIRHVRAQYPRLECQFDDGDWRVFDMSRILESAGPMAQPLLKKTFFAKAFIDAGAVTWPNGYDLCPNVIHAASTPLKRTKHP